MGGIHEEEDSRATAHSGRARVEKTSGRAIRQAMVRSLKVNAVALWMFASKVMEK
jgi:hypothetical protein